MPSFLDTKNEIPGFETDKSHPNWIPLDGVEFGVSNGCQGTDKKIAGEVSADTLTLTKPTDASVASMQIKCGKAEVIPQMVVEVCDADHDRTVLERYTLENARLRHVHNTVTGEGRRSTTVEVIFEKVKFEQRKPDGTYIEGTWSNVECVMS